MTDREKLIELMGKRYEAIGFNSNITEKYADYLLANGANIPSADAVEVVRCKDCKYFWGVLCINDFGLVFCRGDDFCSYGERKV